MTALEQGSGQLYDLIIPTRLSDQPCGTRTGFRRGCRCLPCKAANARRDPTPWVDASEARAHLEYLEALTPSIGVHQAAKLSGLSATHLLRIRTGEQGRIKVTTARAVLAIEPIAAPGQHVNGYRTRDYIARLVKEGYTRSRLALQLGHEKPELRMRERTVTVRNALLVRRLFDTLTAEDAGMV